MRRITIFDDVDFELLAAENNFNIDAKREWKYFIKKKKLASDVLLDYDQMMDLIIQFNGSPIDDFDIAFEIIRVYENKHPEKLEKNLLNPHPSTL